MAPLPRSDVSHCVETPSEKYEASDASENEAGEATRMRPARQELEGGEEQRRRRIEKGKNRGGEDRRARTEEAMNELQEDGFSLIGEEL